MRRALTGVGLLVLVLAGPVAIAAPYPPPSGGAGEVSPSRVAAGGCVTFSGDGFAANAAVTISDDDAPRPSTQASATGSFSTPVCFNSQAHTGRHVLRGEGEAASVPGTAASFFLLRPANAAATRVVTATVFVTGIEQSTPVAAGPGPGVGSGPLADAPRGDRLVFTGLPAITLALVGTALLTVGALVLLVTEQRHRRRRSRTA